MKDRIPFQNRMTGLQTALGWIYFPLHVIVLPLLLGIFAAFYPGEISDVTVNLAYFCVGVAFVLIVMLRFLRSGFDAFLDRPGFCLMTMLLALAMVYVMSLAVSVVLLLLGDQAENPNNAEVMRMAGREFGAVAAMTVFLAPLVEETLFRGVVFGSIRTRSRLWAYVISAVLFSLDHVWQYAAAYSDPMQLVYAVQYLPVSVALAWCYERTGSIWTSILFHMGYNALSFMVLSNLSI